MYFIDDFGDVLGRLGNRRDWNFLGMKCSKFMITTHVPVTLTTQRGMSIEDIHLSFVGSYVNFWNVKKRSDT